MKVQQQRQPLPYQAEPFVLVPVRYSMVHAVHESLYGCPAPQELFMHVMGQPQQKLEPIVEPQSQQNPVQSTPSPVVSSPVPVVVLPVPVSPKPQQEELAKRLTEEKVAEEQNDRSDAEQDESGNDSRNDTPRAKEASDEVHSEDLVKVIEEQPKEKLATTQQVSTSYAGALKKDTSEKVTGDSTSKKWGDRPATKPVEPVPTVSRPLPIVGKKQPKARPISNNNGSKGKKGKPSGERRQKPRKRLSDEEQQPLEEDCFGDWIANIEFETEQEAKEFQSNCDRTTFVYSLQGEQMEMEMVVHNYKSKRDKNLECWKHVQFRNSSKIPQSFKLNFWTSICNFLTKGLKYKFEQIRTMKTKGTSDSEER